MQMALNDFQFDADGRRIVKLIDNVVDGVPTCPHCGCTDSKVTVSYAWADNKRRRRRVCANCELPFWTVQNAEEIEQ